MHTRNDRPKKLDRWLAGLLVAAAVIASIAISHEARAQSVPGTIKLFWVLPTTGCSVGVTPCDNKPLTGNGALTAVNVWVSTSPIADDFGGPPTLSLTASATTTTHTMQVTSGTTLYARIKAINPAGASPFSEQVIKLIEVPVIPGPPTNVTIELTIGG